MRTHIVEIGDGAGNSFKIKIETVYSISISRGHWRTLDKGFIRYNSGETNEITTEDGIFISKRDLILLNADNTWGIKLKNFTGQFFANDHGKGELLQPWALKAKPGTISWIII